MNFTRELYPQPYAPHHLGYWPIADLPSSKQENMPLEETSWNLLVIALLAQVVVRACVCARARSMVTLRYDAGTRRRYDVAGALLARH
jgi:hypothetical protein